MGKLLTQLHKRVLILDGDLIYYIDKNNLRKYDYHGSRFMQHPKNLTGFYEILNLTYPQLITEIYERFYKSGADIVRTNTSRANEYYLSQYELANLAYEINYTAAKLARDVAVKYSLIDKNRPRFVFGRIGDIEKQVSRQDAELVYSQQIKGLMAGKVDVIYFENFKSFENLQLVLEVLDSILKRRNRRYPVAITLSGDLQESMFEQIEPLVKGNFTNIDLIAVGQGSGGDLNISAARFSKIKFGNDIAKILCVDVSRDLQSNVPVEEFSQIIKRLVEDGLVNILCAGRGASVDYVEALDKLVKELSK